MYITIIALEIEKANTVELVMHTGENPYVNANTKIVITKDYYILILVFYIRFSPVCITMVFNSMHLKRLTSVCITMVFNSMYLKLFTSVY